MTLPKQVIENTLVDYPRLYKLVELIEQCGKLPGAMAEVGVYKGGTAFLLLAAAPPLTSKYLFDTFEGLPLVSKHDRHHTGNFKSNFEDVYNLLVQAWHTDNWSLIQGKFPEETGFAINDETFSFVHIDVDIYPSVKACLEFFAPKMVKTGIIVLDDYNAFGCEGAKLAANEFCVANGYKIEETVQCQAIIRF